ncbi:MAG: lytic transglycosylase domain-containing protein, partial [Spirochaetes bacterium]|nr:lytic transglycosylase domain-containing protein [Spirochaetota bacterium]
EMIHQIFEESNIPLEFSYLAFVESQYQPKAKNYSSGAKGMWQLMTATARHYGLKVNRKIDERIDPVLSTRAAAAYLKDLVAIFGINNLTLAMAAYNAGDSAIVYSLKKIENPQADRNFWYLYQHNLIPDETKEYVLKVIAVLILNEYLNLPAKQNFD